MFDQHPYSRHVNFYGILLHLPCGARTVGRDSCNSLGGDQEFESLHMHMRAGVVFLVFVGIIFPLMRLIVELGL